MQHISRTFLAASIGSALLIPTANGESLNQSSVQDMPTTGQCQVDVSSSEDNSKPVVVKSDHLQAVNGDKATYSGNVEVVQGTKVITANNVTLHQKENKVVAEGNVTFKNDQVKATSDRAINNMNDDTFELENTQYQFLCKPGRGKAQYISKTGQAIYKMQDGSLTFCPEGDDSWRLVASGIDVDQNEETATFYNPRFEIMDVPVFYFPYLTLPIGDTRKTGFLYPSVSYGSSDGLKTETPYYLNLAPNYDLTFTPIYMQKRGMMYNSEFRYLSKEYGQGSLTGEYMAKDRKYSDAEKRWGFQYKHSGIINRQWLVSANYAKVSDINYFQDLSSDIGNREDGQLLQEGSVAYRSDHWDMSMQVRDFQILLEDGTQPYRALPQLKFNYYMPLWGENLNFDVKSQLTRFDTDDTAKPDATRLHIEPGLTIPLANTWADWTTEGRILATYYNQDINGITDADTRNSLDENVSRVLPEFRSHARVYLERDIDWFGSYTQSLEPQIQYLYVPSKNQSNIYNYDTTLLQTDYYGLFRSRKYSSIDKIAPANQLSYGASTRFFDDQYKERMNISFGQIYYIDKKTKIAETEDHISNYSSWAVEADFNYNDYLFYHGGIQYDIDLDSVQLANSTLEYQFKKGFIQGNYRYVTKDYIENNLSLDDIDTITRKGISQAGIVSSYQISPKWSVAGQYYHDMNENIALEWLASVRYNSDCWYVGLSYANQLTGWNQSYVGGSNNSAKYEDNIGITFGIRGFATNHSADTAATELNSSDNSIKYGRPFYLNN